MQEDNQKTNGRVWLIVLAAGQSKRMGTPKMLLPFNGVSMIQGIVRRALSVVREVAVVLRREGHEEKALLSDLPVLFLYPSPGRTLMSDSLKTAVQFCLDVKADAVIFLLGDQPDIDPTVIQQLIESYQTTKSSIIQAHYWDGPSHPILFHRLLFSELMQVTGDQGAREVLKRHSSKRTLVRIPKNQPQDFDTPDDYETYLNT